MSNYEMSNTKEHEIKLEELVKRACGIRDESNRIANKVGGIVDDVIGSEPTPECDIAEKKPQNESLFNRIMNPLDEIKNNLTQIEFMIDRL